MPFVVVVITAVVIVNNGDDNAWCFVSALPFVVLPKQGLLAEEPLQLQRSTFFTLRATLCHCSPPFFEFKSPDANPEFICL